MGFFDSHSHLNDERFDEDRDKVIKEIIIKKEVVDPEDVEMLQDLVLTAVNEALSKADSMMQSELGQFNVPGLF